ncbi:MAG: FHA domain-containing protein [Planctomycetota bacterium]|nr:FHA domain-containing protein [Planctomycetota bacterium]
MATRVVLEATDRSDDTFRRFSIDLGEQCVVGRVPERCDIAFEVDRYLSGAHFRIHATPHGCEIEDLNSRSGTRVGGDKIPSLRRYPVPNGGFVVAGKTSFKITIHGASTSPTAGGLTAELPAIDWPKNPRSKRQPLVTVQYRRLPLEGDWIGCEGTIAELSLEELAERLRQAWAGNLHLCVDLNRIPNGVLPAGMSGTQVLSEFSPRISPVVTTVPGGADWTVLSRAARGRDALILFFTASAARNRVAGERLRDSPDAAQVPTESIRDQPHNRNAPGPMAQEEVARSIADVCLGTDSRSRQRGVLGACWPMILEACLRSSPANVLEPLRRQTDAILLASDEFPDKWFLALSTEFEPLLCVVGLVAS